MHLESLTLFNFRNYENLLIQFKERNGSKSCDGIYILYGENGAGKTNILEAIFYLAITKSFRTKQDRYLIGNKQEMFRIAGDFLTKHGQSYQVSIAYSKKDGKHLSVNGQKIQKFSEHIGEIPVVLLNPSDLQLSQGSPLQRRRSLDILLSQSNKLYLHNLIQFRKSLRQRNFLLQAETPDIPLIQSYEENLIKYGSQIISKRMETIDRIGELVQQYYQQLSKTEDKVKIVYQTSIPLKLAPQSIEEIFRKQFNVLREKELQIGNTQLGPHRDDLLFLINGKPMKTYASQGEHKTFIIALKLAEFQFLQHTRNETPIMLFDDIFGELDANRIQQMLNLLGKMGQVFVTTTSRTFFDKVQRFDVPVRYYHVKQGTIIHE